MKWTKEEASKQTYLGKSSSFFKEAAQHSNAMIASDCLVKDGKEKFSLREPTCFILSFCRILTNFEFFNAFLFLNIYYIEKKVPNMQ